MVSVPWLKAILKKMAQMRDFFGKIFVKSTLPSLYQMNSLQKVDNCLLIKTGNSSKCFHSESVYHALCLIPISVNITHQTFRYYIVYQKSVQCFVSFYSIHV